MWWIRYRKEKTILVLNKRCGRPSVLGETVLGYQDRGHAIRALKSSCFLALEGIPFSALELFNGVNTMDEMVTWPVLEGFSLRHRIEKWWWRHPSSGRVWYRKAAVLEGVWKENERAEAVQYRRKLRVGPAAAKLELVRGFADKHIETMPNWFV